MSSKTQFSLTVRWFLVILPSLLIGSNAKAGSIPGRLLGDWSLKVESGKAGWMSIGENQGEPEVAMLVEVGSHRMPNRLGNSTGERGFQPESTIFVVT